MDPTKWRIEGVSKGHGQWAYALYEPSYVQTPIVVSDSYDRLWHLIDLLGYMNVYATTDSYGYRWRR